MKKCCGKLVEDRLIEMRVLNGNRLRQNRGDLINRLLRNQLGSVIRPALRALLAVFLVFFQLLAKITTAFTLHLRLVPVLAKISGDIFLIQPKIQRNKITAEILSQESD
jgi:hypothetical protein